MSSIPGSPLDRSHLDGLNELCRSCQVTDQLIRACEDCGIPMEDRREKNQWHQETANRIKSVFFRNEP